MLLKGYRNYKDGIWDVPLHDNERISRNNNIQAHNDNIVKMNYIVQNDKAKFKLAQYLHACAFSPPMSTFQEYIRRGNFITWPGIEEINFSKLLKTTLSTAKGHLQQERERVNLQSTKPHLDNFPTKISLNTHHCYSTIIPAPTKGRT